MSSVTRHSSLLIHFNDDVGGRTMGHSGAYSQLQACLKAIQI